MAGKESEKFSLETLKALQSKSRTGKIEFNSDLLKQFSSVDHKSRNYHIFILFNALDRETNCEVCGVIAEVFRSMVDIFKKKAKKGSHPSFFATIELKNNMEAFQMMGLDHVPVIMHFGPEKREPKTFGGLNPNDPSSLLNFITEQSGSKLDAQIALQPSVNYKKAILFATLSAILVGLLIYTGVISASTVFQNSLIWSVSILSFIIVMLSGYMWVKIRNPPYIGSAGNRQAQYFLNSPQSQLGVESRIISALNCGIVLSFLLITVVTYKFEDSNKRRIAAMVMSLLYMAGHAGLMKIFAVKFSGYPLSYIF